MFLIAELVAFVLLNRANRHTTGIKKLAKLKTDAKQPGQRIFELFLA
jgi:hypothetical protein